jgi:spermidine synthase
MGGAGRWRRWRSHLADVPLERVPSPEGHPELPELELWMRDGRVVLATPGAIYSYGDRYRSFREAFAHPREGLGRWRPDTLLVLGYGLGSVPELMDRRHGLRPKASAVDLDPRLPALVARYGRPEQAARTDWHAADALAWVPGAAAAGRAWDLVCVDLFVDATVPSGCSAPGFLDALRRLVAPGGRLYWSRLTDEPAEERLRFEAGFGAAFPGAASIVAGGNRVWVWPSAEGRPAG